MVAVVVVPVVAMAPKNRRSISEATAAERWERRWTVAWELGKAETPLADAPVVVALVLEVLGWGN